MANGSAECGPGRVSDLVTATVAPRARHAYENLGAALSAKAAEFDGFVDTEVFPPPPGDDHWAAVITFESEAALQRWRASPERTELLSRIRLVATDQDWVLPNGFGTWSSGDAYATANAPAWKQAMLALAVLYAMVSVLNITLGNFIGNGLRVEGNQVVAGLGLPFPVVVFVGNAVGTVLLTWVLMPVVSRLLSWWLNPAASRAQTFRGVLLILVVYLIELMLFDWVFRTFGF